MALSYLSIAILAVIALIVPSSLILASKLIRLRKDSNRVSRQNFESAEHTIGSGSSVMAEYFHYFTGFLAFEVIVAVLLLWVYVQNYLTQATDLYFFGFLIFAMVMGYLVMLFAVKRGAGHE